MSTLRPARATLLAAAIWAFVCAAGFSLLWAYNGRSGQDASAPPRWPGRALARANDRPSLVMFIHPHCPCTTAALGELDWILAHAPGASVTMILVRPKGVPAGWEETDSWRKARNMPGAKVVLDDDGALARIFGAHVSGQVLVYDASGALSFSGGITFARGHRGDNPGRDAALAALNGAEGEASWPVFGCTLTSLEPERRRSLFL